MVQKNTLTLWKDKEGIFSILESEKSNDHRDSGFINSDLLLKTVKESFKTAPSVSYDPKNKLKKQHKQKTTNFLSFYQMFIKK